MKFLRAFALVLALTSRVWSQPVSPAFEPEFDVKRLMVGQQAGIVKVFQRDGTEVAFFRGIDDRDLAPLDDAARCGIFTSLGLNVSKLGPAVSQMMGEFYRLPRSQAVALLGAIGSYPKLDADTRRRLQKFVIGVLEDPDVATRRQAILALAVMEPNAQISEAVVKIYERSQNAWETFPVQQFFEYHAQKVKKLPEFNKLRQRLAAVESMYTPLILGYLETPERQERVESR